MGLFGGKKTELRQDVADAEQRMGAHVGTGKALRIISEQLLPDERVIEMCTANIQGGQREPGVLAVTTKRIWYVANNLGNHNSKVIPMKNVTEVSAKSTALGIINGNSVTVTHAGGSDSFQVGNRNVERMRAAAVNAQLL